MASSQSWQKIFKDYDILNHDFRAGHFVLSNKMIKKSCQDFTTTGEKEVRILCKQDSREDVPDIMREHGLFLLPIKMALMPSKAGTLSLIGEGDTIHGDAIKLTADRALCHLFLNGCHQKMGFSLEISRNTP